MPSGALQEENWGYAVAESLQKKSPGNAGASKSIL